MSQNILLLSTLWQH